MYVTKKYFTRKKKTLVEYFRRENHFKREATVK